MKKTRFFNSVSTTLLTCFVAIGCAQDTKNNDLAENTATPSSIESKVEKKEVHFEIVTDFGTMKGKLYNETPQHRDNFVKLAKEGYYDSLLFHRVIKGFMIQGGDPNSKNATPGQQLGNGGPGYTIPAEILPQFHHKKGALSAARQGDQVNPEKRSSGSQFYVVQGKPYSNGELQNMEAQMQFQQMNMGMNNCLQQPEHQKDLEAVMRYQRSGQQDSLQMLFKKLEPEVKKLVGEFKFTEQQKKDYASIGGTPHLDNNYTVFGEIYEGLEIIDKIAAVETAPGDRPKKDVKMAVRIVE